MVLACLGLSSPSHAGLLSVLFKGGTKVAAGGARGAAMAAAAGTRSATVVTLRGAGQLELAAVKAGSVAAVATLAASDDLAKQLAAIGGPLLLPAEVAAEHPWLLREVLEQRRGLTELVDADGMPAPVKLAQRGGAQAVVVQIGPSVTISPQAWLRRGILEQDLMRDLASRMRVVAIVDRTDQVQRQAFKARLGDKVVFVDSREALREALHSARKRLVAVVGHVEGDRFVLRDAGSRVVIDEPIAGIHRQIDVAHSVSLALGCNVACMAPGSGPTAVIDAMRVAKAIGASSDARTPLQFLGALASEVGPLHVDIDLYGRLRAVSEANVRASDRAVGAAGMTTRVLFAREPAAPLSVADAASTLYMVLVAIPLMVVFMSLFVWLLLFFIGMGPRTTWRTVKSNFAVFCDRGEEQIDRLGPWERPLLIVFGPLGVALQVGGVGVVAAANAATGLLACLLFPLFLGPGRRLQIDPDGAAMGAGWIGPAIPGRVGATALLVAACAAGWLLVLVAFPAAPVAAQICGLLAAGAGTLFVLLRKPELGHAWFLMTGLVVFVAQLPFVFVRYTAARLARLAPYRRAAA